MKKNRIGKFLLSIIPFLLLTSCISIMPTKTPEEISDALTLEYPFGKGNQDYGQVTVWITNTSTYCIVFPTDFGIKLFVNINGNTSEIPNRTIYLGDRSNYLRPKGNLESTMGLVFSPDSSLFNSTREAQFYAEITGHICDEESTTITKVIPFMIIE